ncbi:hypothetical protein NKH18_27160 [Streptomyces sp. M10(2022)]
MLTRAQAEVLREVAGRLGDGELHLTSRGNLQLRGLGPDCGTELAELAELLRGAGCCLPNATNGHATSSPRPSRVSTVRGTAASGHGWPRWTDCCAEVTRPPRSRAGSCSRSTTAVVMWTPSAPTSPCSPGATAARSCGSGTRTPSSVSPPGRSRAAILAAEVFLDAAADSGAWRVKDLPGDALAALPDAVVRELRRAGIPVTRNRPTPPAPGRPRCTARTARPRSPSAYLWDVSTSSSGGS